MKQPQSGKKNGGMTHLLHKQTKHKRKNILNGSLIKLKVYHNFEMFKEGLQRAVKTELVKARAV